MNSLAGCRDFFITVFQQVYHIIGGATCKYYKRQEHQDLHNSSVAVMQKEVRDAKSIRDTHLNAGFILIFSTNNHPTQHHAANDVDCCFMAA